MGLIPLVFIGTPHETLFPMLVEESTLWSRRQMGESPCAQWVLSREVLGPWLYIEVLGGWGGQDGRGTGGADLGASQKHLPCSVSSQRVL